MEIVLQSSTHSSRGRQKQGGGRRREERGREREEDGEGGKEGRKGMIGDCTTLERPRKDLLSLSLSLSFCSFHRRSHPLLQRLSPHVARKPRHAVCVCRGKLLGRQHATEQRTSHPLGMPTISLQVQSVPSHDPIYSLPFLVDRS